MLTLLVTHLKRKPPCLTSCCFDTPNNGCYVPSPPSLFFPQLCHGFKIAWVAKRFSISSIKIWTPSVFVAKVTWHLYIYHVKREADTDTHTHTSTTYLIGYLCLSLRNHYIDLKDLRNSSWRGLGEVSSCTYKPSEP